MQLYPRARRAGLTTCELPDETLVFDHERQKGHCLNATSALVWRLCDGRTSLDELARRVAAESSSPITAEAAAEVVGLALEQLGRRHLLEQAPEPLPPSRRVSRRDALRRLAFVVSLPLVLTVATKAAAQTISNEETADPPPPPKPVVVPVTVSIDPTININAGSSRPKTAVAVPAGPCRTKGQSCIAAAPNQQGTCCRGLTCTGLSQNAGVCG
jgi:hypothetical protein